jgi:hypothetical protein
VTGAPMAYADDAALAGLLDRALAFVTQGG